MKRLALTFVLGMTVLSGFSSASLAQQSTQEVWQHHINAWQARDLEGIVADYTPDAYVILNNDVYQGKAAIKGLFAKLFSTFDRATQHEIDPALVLGKLVYITWRAEIDQRAIPMGTDTFVIENGKITYQTITSNPKLFTK